MTGNAGARFAWLPVLCALAVVGVVLSPLSRDVLDDGFPLSTYPMFVQPRTEADLHRAYGLGAQGERVELQAAHIVHDAEEPMAAVVSLMRAARHRRLRAPLCAEVAARVRADPNLADVRTIEMVVQRWAPIAYYTHEGGEGSAPTPISERVFATCTVSDGKSTGQGPR